MGHAGIGGGRWYKGLDLWDRALKAVCGPFDTKPIEGLSPAGAKQGFEGRIGVHRVGGLLDVADLAIDPCRITKDRRALAHSEDRYVFLILQRAGHARLFQNGRMAYLAPGDCALIDSRRESEFILAGGVQQLSYHLPWPRLRDGLGGARAERLPFATRVCGGTLTGRQLTRYLVELVARPPTAEGAEDAMNGLLETLAALIDEKAEPAPARAERLLTALDLYLERRLHDPELDVEQMARDNNLSRRTLYRLFALRGSSPMGWLWRLRLTRAREMLQDPRFSAWSVTEVALACGFRDHAHFTRRFKEQFGRPPSRMRLAG